MSLMVGERVRIGTRVDQLVRITHTNKIQRNASATVRERGHHITPEIARRRVPVLKNDRRPLTHFDVCHAPTIDLDKTFRVFLS